MSVLKVATSIIALLFAACGIGGAQTTTASKTLDKRDLVTKEWITDIATNLKFLDHETIYDSEGRKIEETEYSKSEKQWTKKYEYSESGLVSRELTYNGKGKLDNIQKFDYNEFGKKKIVYTYDAKGKLVKTKAFEYSYRENVAD